eukprot:COSAG02_NODE_100_length_36897_cov_9.681749_15_plen_46_part_00
MHAQRARAALGRPGWRGGAGAGDRNYNVALLHADTSSDTPCVPPR